VDPGGDVVEVGFEEEVPARQHLDSQKVSTKPSSYALPFWLMIAVICVSASKL
jgi:hypothetical protein